MQTYKKLASGLFVGALALAISTAPAYSQISLGIVIGRTPPPVRFERRPPPPAEGYAWVDGYWSVNRGHYVWVPGLWQRPPYEGAYWNHPIMSTIPMAGTCNRGIGIMKTIADIMTTDAMITAMPG